jgi:hypothetical protein
MRRVTQLPATYKQRGSIDLKHDKKVQATLSIFSLLALVISGWLFFLLAIHLSPAFPTHFASLYPFSRYLDLIS